MVKDAGSPQHRQLVSIYRVEIASTSQNCRKEKGEDVVKAISRSTRVSFVALSTILLASCGGGGGGGGGGTSSPPTPTPPANQPIGPVSDVIRVANEVAENEPAGASVEIVARATDPDASDTVTYTLTDDAGGLFNIDATFGGVTTTQPLDFEAGSSYSITVQASSSDGSSSSASFSIDVIDVGPAISAIFPMTGLTDDPNVDVRFNVAAAPGTTITGATVTVGGTQAAAAQSTGDLWRLDNVTLSPGVNAFSLSATDDSGETATLDTGGVRYDEFIGAPRAMAVDSANNVAYVMDDTNFSNRTIKAVDLTTGAVSVVTGPARGNGTPLEITRSLAVDVAGGRLFADSSQRIYEIDIATGDRTVLDQLPSNVARSTVGVLAWDPTRNRLLQSGDGPCSGCAQFFDPSTGNFDSSLELNAGRLNPRIEELVSMAVDPTDGTIYLFDGDGQRVVAAVPETGAWSEVSGSAVGSGVDFVDIESGALDIAADGPVVFDAGSSAVVAIDKATGARSILSDSATGTGDEFGNEHLAIGATTSGVVVLEAGGLGVRLIDRATGDRAVTHDSSAGSGGVVSSVRGAFYDEDEDRVIVLDGGGRILEVDLESGNRSTLFDSADEPTRTFDDPSYMVFNPLQRDIYLHDRASERILVLDINGFFPRSVGQSNRSDPPAMAVAEPQRRIYFPDGQDVGSWNTSVFPFFREGDVVDYFDFASAGVSNPAAIDRNNVTYDPSTGRILIVSSFNFDLQILSADTASNDVALESANIGPGRNGVEVLQPALDGDTFYVPTENWDPGDASLVAFDLPTQTATNITAFGVLGSGPSIRRAQGVTVLRSGESALIVDELVGLVLVDLETGNRQVVVR